MTLFLKIISRVVINMMRLQDSKSNGTLIKKKLLCSSMVELVVSRVQNCLRKEIRS